MTDAREREGRRIQGGLGRENDGRGRKGRVEKGRVEKRWERGTRGE